MNDPSSTFFSPPPIPNIESFSQSTISSLDSGSFVRNRSDGNIQQPTTSEVANTEKVVAGNEDIDTPPCYYIVKWTGNAYTLQEKYKCHAFNPPVIIP